MIFPPDPVFAYLPLVPPWLYDRINNCWLYYLDTYERLAADYSQGSSEFYSANGLTLDAVNAARTSADPSVGVIDGPFVGLQSSTGEPVQAIIVTIEYAQDPNADALTLALAQTWALAVGQVYATLVAQQLDKLTHFGRFGRHKKPEE